MNATKLLAHFDRLAEAPEAVPRLRRFILDLAVRGKLVAQDAGDEPAAALLKRIQKTKAQALAAGTVKPEKAIQTHSKIGESISIPATWAWVCLQDLCLSIADGDHLPPPQTESGVPFLVIGNVRNQSIDFIGCRYVAEAYYQNLADIRRPTQGDILYTLVGSYGIPVLVKDARPFCVQRHIGILRPSSSVSLKFIVYLMCSGFVFNQASDCATGIAQKTVPLSGLRAIRAPLPPLAEQHRIVAKVDELMALCDQLEAAQQERERRRDRLAAASLQRLNQPAATTTPEAQREYARFHLQNLPRLTKRPEHIKAMRQTFFNLAVSGKLVAQRADDEPIEKLLKRLGVKEVKLPSEATLHAIPDTWAWVTIEQLANVSSGTTPSRDVSDYYSADGTPWVTSGETSNEFIVKTAQHVSDRALKETSLKLYPPGTLIVAMYGQGRTRGQVAELSIAATTNQACAAIVLKLEEAGHRRYVKLFFQKIYEEIRELAAGGAQPNLNGGKIKATVIPLPPLAEQHRIVAKVDELMALCDQLEAELTTTQTDSRRLLEAVLEAALAPA